MLINTALSVFVSLMSGVHACLSVLH